MRSKAAQLLFSAVFLLLAFSASAHLTPPALPDLSGHGPATLPVAVDLAESAMLAAIGDRDTDEVDPDIVQVIVLVFSDEPERGYVGFSGQNQYGPIWILYEGKLPLGLYELEVIDGKLSARHKNQSTWTDISLLHGMGYDLSSIQTVLEHWEGTHSDFNDLTVAAMEARFAPINRALFASVESDPRFVPGDSEGIAWLRQRLDDRKALTMLHPERGRRAYGALTRHVTGSAGVMAVTGTGTGYDVSPQAAYMRLCVPAVSHRRLHALRPAARPGGSARNVGGITSAQARTLRRLLAEVPGVLRVRAFGSRTNGTWGEHSDLDIILIGKVTPSDPTVQAKVAAAQSYALSIGIPLKVGQYRPLDIHVFASESEVRSSFLNSPDFDPSAGVPGLVPLE